MANYPVPENPTYDANIRALEATDKVKDTVVNPLVEKLISNTHAVKLAGDKNTAALPITVTAAGTATAYTASLGTLVVGKPIYLKLHVACGDNFTLNSSIVYYGDQSRPKAGDYAKDSILAVAWNGTSFFALGANAPKLTGDAAVGDVISGKTFYNTDSKSKQAGTLALSGTAAAADVASGKTFYTNDPKTKQTGSLALSGDVTTADVLSGKTFYSNSFTKQTGALALSGNAAAGDVVSGKTFYNTDAKTKQTGTLALSGSAAAGDVLSGSTFYSTNPQSKQTGTLALSGNAAAADVLSGKTFYNTNVKSRLTGALALTGDVTAADVRAGKTFYGTDPKTKQTGTLVMPDTYMGQPVLNRKATGSVNLGTSITLVNVGFRPAIVTLVNTMASTYQVFANFNGYANYPYNITVDIDLCSTGFIYASGVITGSYTYTAYGYDANSTTQYYKNYALTTATVSTSGTPSLTVELGFKPAYISILMQPYQSMSRIFYLAGTSCYNTSLASNIFTITSTGFTWIGTGSGIMLGSTAYIEAWG